MVRIQVLLLIDTIHIVANQCTPQAPNDIVKCLPTSATRPYDLAIFLVSPSLARLVDPQSPFLADAVTHIFRNSVTQDTAVTTLIAIVDRIPGTPGSRNENGEFDGLSLYLDRLDLGAPDLLAKSTASEDSVRSREQPGVLTFEVSNALVDVPERLTESVEVPLANTLFSNGRLSTMFKIPWDISGDVVSPGPTTYISKQRVIFTGPKWTTTLKVPLIPLTSARKIRTSMGNIIRQISGPDDVDMPASSELEKAVLQYSAKTLTTMENVIQQLKGLKREKAALQYEKKRRRMERLKIWACIYPPHSKTLDLKPDAWSSISNKLSDQLLAGARLHRVQSGGGGWGAKQGLLSLDPEQSFLESETDSSPDESRLFGSGDYGYAVTDIAKEDELIQFFVTTDSWNGTLDPQRKSSTYVFGACAAQEDASNEGYPISSNPARNEDSGEQQLISSLSNYFGALSEKGISIRQDRETADGKPLTSRKTKLDVPSSCIRMRLRHSKIVSSWPAKTLLKAFDTMMSR